MMDTAFESVTISAALLAVLAWMVRVLHQSPSARAFRDAARARRRDVLIARRTVVGTSPLSMLDVRRLTAFRRRAIDLHGEPVGPLTLGQRWGQLRRRGLVPWTVASGVGAFSMATHFTVLWFAVGGGWLGAVLITLGSTFIMTAICVWLVMRFATRG